MKIRQFQVDAFTSQLFGGNPAAVCPLERWLDDALMQRIAAENNLSETAFFVPANTGFELRWFTPTKEVELCGHATLATAHVLFHHLDYSRDTVEFSTRGGDLRVSRNERGFTMDFPAHQPKVAMIRDDISQALGKVPKALFTTDDYMAVYSCEADIVNLKPNMAALATLKLRGVIVTAEGDDVDFVSRFFAPKYGIPEDPVTGSAHCVLTPFWADHLEKTKMSARQLSPRGGEIDCELRGDRVLLSGSAVTFLEGTLHL